MDVIKLAALSWNGKETVRGFLKRVYDISFYVEPEYRKLEKRDTLIVTWRKERTSYLVSFSEFRGKWNNLDTVVDKILCLFYTDNGIVYGPDGKYLQEEHEWT